MPILHYKEKRIRWTLRTGLGASILKYRSHPPTFHWIKDQGGSKCSEEKYNIGTGQGMERVGSRKELNIILTSFL